LEPIGAARLHAMLADACGGFSIRVKGVDRLTWGLTTYQVLRAGSAPCRCTGRRKRFRICMRCAETQVEDGPHAAGFSINRRWEAWRSPWMDQPGLYDRLAAPRSLTWGFTVSWCPKCRCGFPPLFHRAESPAFAQVSASQGSYGFRTFPGGPVSRHSGLSVSSCSKAYSALAGAESRFRGPVCFVTNGAAAGRCDPVRNVWAHGPAVRLWATVGPGCCHTGPDRAGRVGAGVGRLRRPSSFGMGRCVVLSSR
jgi:hypothetical protein